MLIVACNTASAYGLEALKQTAKIPVVGVIEAGIEAVSRLSHAAKDDKILVIGTRATISSKLYQNKLQDLGYTNIDAVATPLFVPIVEEGLFGSEVLQKAMEHYFSGLSAPKVVVLACTHFPLITAELGAYFKGAELIHSGDAMADHLRRQVGIRAQSEKTALELYASGSINELKKIANSWLK